MDRGGRKKVLGWVEAHFGVERVRRKQRVTEKRKKNLKASGNGSEAGLSLHWPLQKC